MQTAKTLEAVLRCSLLLGFAFYVLKFRFLKSVRTRGFVE